MTPFARCSTRCPDPAGFVHRGYMTKYIHPWSWSDVMSSGNSGDGWSHRLPLVGGGYVVTARKRLNSSIWLHFCRHHMSTILRSLPQLNRFDSSIRVTVGLCWKTMLCNYIQLHLG